MTAPTRYRIGRHWWHFTDGVLLDEETGHLILAKVLTTSEDPSTGARKSMLNLLLGARLQPADVSIVIHGTTLAGYGKTRLRSKPTRCADS